MSLTLNMVGGSGGGISGNDAVLQVTTLVGSTVTITNNGTTKTQDSSKAHILDDDNTKAVYVFGIKSSEFGTWAVTATLTGFSDSDSIAISTTELYSVSLNPVVPDGYQAVEYIQSSGTQCLVTPDILMDSYSSSNKYLISCKYRPTAAPSGTKYIFGIENASSPQFGPVYLMQSSHDRVFIGSISEADVQVSSANTDYSLEFLMENSNLTVTRNSTVLINSRAFGNSVGVGVPCGIISCFFRGSILTNSAYLPSLRLYYWQYAVNDTLVYDMIPCYRKSDSVAGMFDRVTNTFCMNQGSGTFTVGADI